MECLSLSIFPDLHIHKQIRDATLRLYVRLALRVCGAGAAGDIQPGPTKRADVTPSPQPTFLLVDLLLEMAPPTFDNCRIWIASGGPTLGSLGSRNPKPMIE